MGTETGGPHRDPPEDADEARGSDPAERGAESYGGDPDAEPSLTEDEIERGSERDQAEG